MKVITISSKWQKRIVKALRPIHVQLIVCRRTIVKINFDNIIVAIQSRGIGQPYRLTNNIWLWLEN